MEDVAAAIRAFLQNETVQYWGVWIALGLVTFTAVAKGLPQYKEAVEALEKAAEIKNPDNRVKLFSTKKRRLKASFDALVRSGQAAASALLPIVGVPLVVLVLVTLASEWFFGSSSIVTPPSMEAGTVEHTIELAAYFIDQLSRGFLFDAVEIFDWPITEISVAQDNTLYLWMLLGFRLIVDLYVAGLLVLFARAFWGVVFSGLRLFNPF